MAEQAVLYVNGRRRRLPGDRAQQTLLSYLRGARAPPPACAFCCFWGLRRAACVLTAGGLRLWRAACVLIAGRLRLWRAACVLTAGVLRLLWLQRTAG